MIHHVKKPRTIKAPPLLFTSIDDAGDLHVPVPFFLWIEFILFDQTRPIFDSVGR